LFIFDILFSFIANSSLSDSDGRMKGAAAGFAVGLAQNHPFKRQNERRCRWFCRPFNSLPSAVLIFW